MSTPLREGRSRVCVFCGSSSGGRPDYREAAAAVGALLAERGLGLVYGGGSIGLMGVVADAALAAGGEVVGVIPRALAGKEVAHAGLTALHVVDSMHARKAMMAELSDAFVALPGGFGTLEELFEVITWSQLGLHRKPVGLLNVSGYYDGLTRFLDHCMAESFIRPEHRPRLVVAAAPGELLDALARERVPPAPRWITPEET